MNALNKEILRLAVPSILANITVPLVGLVDLAVAGHLDTGAGGAATLIGGITIGAMMFDLLYWNFGFLRTGTGGLTAQAYGRQDWRTTNGVLFGGVLLALAIATIMLIFQWPFARIISLAVKSTPEVMSLGLQYFFIRIWAAPATLGLMAFKGWFIGMQDSVSAMACDFIVNGMNMLASIVLAFGISGIGFAGMGYKGIAVGTVLAQYTGLVFATCRAFGRFHIRLKDSLADGIRYFRNGGLRQFARLNGNLFIRSVCLVIVYIGFTIIAARYGDLLLAASSIMMKLLLLFSYFTDGFAFAGEALTGKFIGMQDRKMTGRTVRGVFIWSMGIGLCFILVYVFGGVPLLRLMTDDISVVEMCRNYFIWLLPMPIVGCAAFTFDSFFIGATASVPLRNSGLWAVAGFFAVWFGLSPFAKDAVISVHILMGAYFAHLAARSVYQWIEFRKAVLIEPFDRKKP